MRFESRRELETIARVGAKMVSDEHGLRARYLSSFWLYVEADDQAFTPHWQDGFWESWVSVWMSQQFEKHETFIDIGANVGYYSMMAAKAGLSVKAFEPNQEVSKMLHRTAIINRTDVDIYNLALSDEAGYADLSVPDGHSGGGHLVDGKTVRVETLDMFNYRRDWFDPLIKIDAEGAEPKIWAGMQKFLSTREDWCVTLEWDKSRFDAEVFADQLLDGNTVSLIDYDGCEPHISREQLLSIPDLRMIVVRKIK
jgi:FkbM family methyltransferase